MREGFLIMRLSVRLGVILLGGKESYRIGHLLFTLLSALLLGAECGHQSLNERLFIGSGDSRRRVEQCVERGRHGAVSHRVCRLAGFILSESPFRYIEGLATFINVAFNDPCD